MENRDDSAIQTDAPEDLNRRRALQRYSKAFLGVGLIALTAEEAVTAANAYPGNGGGNGFGWDKGNGKGGGWGNGGGF